MVAAPRTPRASFPARASGCTSVQKRLRAGFGAREGRQGRPAEAASSALWCARRNQARPLLSRLVRPIPPCAAPMAANENEPGPSGRDAADKRPASPAHAAPTAKRARVELPLPAHPTRARVPAPTSTSAFVVPDRPSPPLRPDDKVRRGVLGGGGRRRGGAASQGATRSLLITLGRATGSPRQAPARRTHLTARRMVRARPAARRRRDTPHNHHPGRPLCVRAGRKPDVAL